MCYGADDSWISLAANRLSARFLYPGGTTDRQVSPAHLNACPQRRRFGLSCPVGDSEAFRGLYYSRTTSFCCTFFGCVVYDRRSRRLLY